MNTMKEIHKEMDECIQSVPPRFRKDAEDLFEYRDDETMWDMRTVRKAWEYFLDDIVQEMSEEERNEYFFG